MNLRFSSRIRKGIRSSLFWIPVVALFAGSLLAARRDSTLVSIGTIQPCMAFSTVQVRGVIEKRPRILSDGTVFLLLADETGSMPVFIDRMQAEHLPDAGTWIAVEGILGMASGSGMRMIETDRIEKLDQPPSVRLQGQVVEVYAPPPDSRAPYRIVLARPEGRLEVVHWFVPRRRLSIGDHITAEGALGIYRGRMQIKVRCAEDLQCIHAP